MKRLIIFLLVSLFYVTDSNSQPFFNNEFTLSMFNHSVFYVRLDDVLYPEQVTKFRLTNVQPGKHLVEVIKYRKNHNRGYMPVVISHRWITIAANSEVKAIVDHDLCLQILEISPNCYTSTPISITNDGHAGHPMHQADFLRLKQTIENASFESSRLIIAKQAISHNKLLSKQVADLMYLFWFESSRLELAKFAYSNVMDKADFYLVNNAFQFESSVSELNEYIMHSS